MFLENIIYISTLKYIKYFIKNAAGGRIYNINFITIINIIKKVL
jgi:hypothetical protein